MYFSPSSRWSDPDTPKTTTSPLSPKLEMFPPGKSEVRPGPSVIIDADSGSRKSQVSRDLHYLPDTLGDNLPTSATGHLFDLGLSSLNLLENTHISPSAILEASAAAGEGLEDTADTDSGIFQSSHSHVRYETSSKFSPKTY